DGLDGVEGSTDAATGEQHVIDQHHSLAVDTLCRDLGRSRRACRMLREVIAKQRDIERPGGDRMLCNTADQRAKPLCEGDTASGNAEENEILSTAVGF